MWKSWKPLSTLAAAIPWIADWWCSQHLVNHKRICQSQIGSRSNTKHAAPKCFPCNTAQLWRQHGNPVAIHYLNPPLALWDANVHGPCNHERHPWQTSVTSSSAVSGQITGDYSDYIGPLLSDYRVAFNHFSLSVQFVSRSVTSDYIYI